MVFTTETLEGVETPVTALPPLLLEDEPPLQPASNNASAANPMPICEIALILCLLVMVMSFFIINMN